MSTIIAFSILSLICPVIVLILLFIGDPEKTYLTRKIHIITTCIAGLIIGYALSPVIYGNINAKIILSIYQTLSAFSIYFIIKEFAKK